MMERMKEKENDGDKSNNIHYKNFDTYHIVLFVGISTVLQQQLYHVDVTVRSRTLQRRTPIL